MLVDMEIPAWDDKFLSQYDPIAMANLYSRAGAESVMFACKNLSGWCLWPTKVGEMHPRLGGRDVVAETIEALAERGIAACAYYAAIYDNWPFEHHPEWRVEPAAGWERSLNGTARDRHGLCCPNSAGYRAFLAGQIADLFGRYEFECAFCDMSFWPTVCVCEACQTRYASESGGLSIPAVVDWTSPEWCAFANARERWIDEFHGFVSDSIRTTTPGIAVYHNFATGTAHWLRGIPLSVTRHSDFLGGDLYGDAVEQLLVTKLMNGLSQTRPIEFMTFATTHAFEHVRLKTLERLRGQVLSATAEDAAFMYIEAIDPLGSAAEAHYDLIAEAFRAGRDIAEMPVARPICDVAVYFSSESRVSFGENGRSVADVSVDDGIAPPVHVAAVRGAVRILQRAHVPFGIATRFDLHSLDRFAVLVLPNLVRMDAEEVAAIRGYVERGGRVYASRYTSLLSTAGTLHDDFMLADVFGAKLGREEPTGLAYLRPATDEARSWFAPQRYLTADPRVGALRGGLLRIAAAPDTRTLAALTLPFGHPESGDVFHRNWASIHTSPPWKDTSEPTIIEHRFGAGRAIYSTLDIEREESEANDRVFAALIKRLIGDSWTVACHSHPSVAVSAFLDESSNALRVTLMNFPRLVIGRTTVDMRTPAGTRPCRVERHGRGEHALVERPDGSVRVELDDLDELEVLLVEFEPR